MTLDEQLQLAQTKALNIQGIANKRDIIKRTIQTFTGATQDDIMMNPLNVLNIALTNEEIGAINDQIVSILAVKLVEVEEELARVINS